MTTSGIKKAESAKVEAMKKGLVKKEPEVVSVLDVGLVTGLTHSEVLDALDMFLLSRAREYGKACSSSAKMQGDRDRARADLIRAALAYQRAVEGLSQK